MTLQRYEHLVAEYMRKQYYQFLDLQEWIDAHIVEEGNIEEEKK